jgi:[CysO sulfur-carrier protein]-S-L-cysteine hydrolase
MTARMLNIPRNLYEAAIKHSIEGLPREVCGILGGSGNSVSSLHRIDNTAAGETRFLMDSKQQIAVFKRLQSLGDKPLAFYHSHPSGPPYPSDTDIKMAYYPDVITVIISLETAEKPLVAAFRIQGHVFDRVGIEITHAVNTNFS